MSSNDKGAPGKEGAPEGPAFPTWNEVVRARGELDEARGELRTIAEIHGREFFRSSSNSNQGKLEESKLLVDVRTRQYEDARDLFFEGGRARDSKIALRMNRLVTTFVVITGVATVVQAFGSVWTLISGGQ
jgi:hypothetical protein